MTDETVDATQIVIVVIETTAVTSGIATTGAISGIEMTAASGIGMTAASGTAMIAGLSTVTTTVFLSIAGPTT
jgi:hypothetical protein